MQIVLNPFCVLAKAPLRSLDNGFSVSPYGTTRAPWPNTVRNKSTNESLEWEVVSLKAAGWSPC